MWQKVLALLPSLSPLSLILHPHPSTLPYPPLPGNNSIPYETDLKFIRASIDALPSPCHFQAYGSVIVNGSTEEIICRGYNTQLSTGDPTEHGEIDLLRNCVSKWMEEGYTPEEIHQRWQETWIYTTAEPCPMCAATILQSGFERVVFGTAGPTLYKLGWTEYLVTLRSATVASIASHQRGFGGGRKITQVVGPVGEDETDGLFGWQFGGGECPSGCSKDGEGVCHKH